MSKSKINGGDAVAAIMQKLPAPKAKTVAAIPLLPDVIDSYGANTGAGVYGGARIELLMEILRTRRPHKSRAETRFAVDYLDSVSGMETDGFGNRILTINGEGDSICYTSHIDTVHNSGGKQNIRKSNDVITLANKSKSNCLGADDAAGIWLMLEMIRAAKPGLYIFHRAEEIGGLGSDFIATHTPKILDKIDCVISLDRYGFDSIITHQGDFCASDIFAKSLAVALDMPNLEPDDSGLFTDSANYVELVGECTNLSVGYFGHHTARESLDMRFLCYLREKLIAMDCSKLIYDRQPGDSDYWSRDGGASMTGGQWANDPNNPAYGDSWLDGLDSHFRQINGDSHTYKLSSDSLGNGFNVIDFEISELAKLVCKYPEIVAEYLVETGTSIDDMHQLIEVKDRLGGAMF